MKWTKKVDSERIILDVNLFVPTTFKCDVASSPLWFTSLALWRVEDGVVGGASGEEAPLQQAIEPGF
jgi:hypothetical protein